MNGEVYRVDRRSFLKFAAALAGNCWLWPGGINASTSWSIKKAIPSTGEMVPVIGMGTSRTFDSVSERERLKDLASVLETFFQHGGTFIDSSPMYGSSEQVIGMLLQRVKRPDSLFAATKVWTDGRESGERQMERSRQLWGIDRFDLIQIHNLRDWRVHLETLQEMKAQGRIRYLGITTSHGRSHSELESVLDRQPFDFVQLSYNIENREVERVLLPMALERGIGVIVNRPFARGALFSRTRDKPLPEWASQIGCGSWGQFFLKYAVSHPAVTCAIPATSKTRHMLDNMGAGYGVLPDSAMRARMEGYLAAL
jgi:diketogulonate reductase-like aldo/keto reductase